jgi:acyl carrier protein
MVTGVDGVLTIGSGVGIGHGAAISCTDAVRIGERSVLGAFVMVMDSDFHVAGDMDTPAPPEAIDIGRDVTIGHRVVVLPGSTIGDGARVRAGSVVTGTIAPFATVAGNPAIDTAGATGSSTPGTVDEVIADVFQLASPLGDEVRPEQVEGWDSLGMLRLLLALEAAFGIVLDEQRLIAVTDVGDIKRLIASS